MLVWDKIFNPRLADQEGLVAAGGDWGAEILIEAYKRGCFPWPQEGLPILWFSPDPRGILLFSELRINRSLYRVMKSHAWNVTFNRAFHEVMEACAKTPRPGQNGTWILPEMLSPYTELFDNGRGLSCEIWNLEGQLVGGLYGVLSEKYFSAESMFYRESGASKFALIKMTQYLQDIHGLDWMDIQMLTPVTESLGGRWLPRLEFLQRISS